MTPIDLSKGSRFRFSALVRGIRKITYKLGFWRLENHDSGFRVCARIVLGLQTTCRRAGRIPPSP